MASEGEARAFIDQVRSTSRDARHHCTAFILGEDLPVERSNDDGEPSGTAGTPMLEVLRGNEIRDAVAVVTRWFGGTLLGTGGLIRAYADSVSAALGHARDSGALVARTRHRLATVSVPMDLAPRFENSMRAQPGLSVGKAEWAASSMTVEVGFPPADWASLEGVVAGLSQGRAALQDNGFRWVDAPTG